jgi:AbrB family looped-hinge helix DNA binding protein
MRASIDKNGRLVIPAALLNRIGLTEGGDVEIEVDGAGLRIRPLSGSEFREADGLLFIPATGTTIDDASVRDMIDADRERRL